MGSYDSRARTLWSHRKVRAVAAEQPSVSDWGQGSVETGWWGGWGLVTKSFPKSATGRSGRVAAGPSGALVLAVSKE